MESLPNELYESIFDHLHLIDLARLKRVCKKFRGLVQDYRIRDLVFSTGVYAIDTLSDADPGFYQNSCIITPNNLKRTIPYQILIRPSENSNSLFQPQHFSPLPDQTFRREFCSYTIFLRSSQFNAQILKSLSYTYSTESDQFNHLSFEEVNKLVLLERLEIRFEIGRNVRKPLLNYGKLTLPNLKILLLDSKGHYDFTIEVDAPRCEGLHLKFSENIYHFGFYLLRVVFGNPRTVKYLSLHDYHEVSHVFENIEFLQIVKGAHLIDDRFFAAFPRLKTLKIMEHNWLDGLRQLFQLSRRGERNVQVVFHGIQLIDGKELDAFQEIELGPTSSSLVGGPNYNHNVFSRLIDNYDKLEDGLNFIGAIEFSDRIAKLLETDAGRFLRKFNNLKQVSSGIKIERPGLFLRLLTGCVHLKMLTIINSGMSQEYFDQLGNIRTLVSLKIEEETQIDFPFISKLPLLGNLSVNQDVDLRQVIKSDEIKGRKAEHLNLSLKIGDNYVTIIKSPLVSEAIRHQYTLTKTKVEGQHSGRSFNFLQNFENLLQRCEEIRNEGNKRMV